MHLKLQKKCLISDLERYFYRREARTIWEIKLPQIQKKPAFKNVAVKNPCWKKFPIFILQNIRTCLAQQNLLGSYM